MKFTMCNRSHRLVNRPLNRGRFRDQTPLNSPIQFTKLTDPLTLPSQQGLKETSILTRTNSGPFPPAGSVGSILSGGLTTLITTRGVRRGIDPRPIKPSTTVPKPGKQMPPVTTITVASSLMICWKLRIPPRSPGTRPLLLIPLLAPLQPAPTLPPLERVHYQPDGKSDIPLREGLTMLTTTRGPQPG